ncbi:hypothetical protein ABW19_dt0205425 [Dactylella cylindrospora]|nr:hypothetical protein ABW19_dt0205425 [Dactylella cylindrospora]
MLPGFQGMPPPPPPPPLPDKIPAMRLPTEGSSDVPTSGTSDLVPATPKRSIGKLPPQGQGDMMEELKAKLAKRGASPRLFPADGRPPRSPNLPPPRPEWATGDPKSKLKQLGTKDKPGWAQKDEEVRKEQEDALKKASARLPPAKLGIPKVKEDVRSTVENAGRESPEHQAPLKKGLEKIHEHGPTHTQGDNGIPASKVKGTELGKEPILSDTKSQMVYKDIDISKGKGIHRVQGNCEYDDGREESGSAYTIWAFRVLGVILIMLGILKMEIYLWVTSMGTTANMGLDIF